MTDQDARRHLAAGHVFQGIRSVQKYLSVLLDVASRPLARVSDRARKWVMLGVVTSQWSAPWRRVLRSRECCTWSWRPPELSARPRSERSAARPSHQCSHLLRHAFRCSGVQHLVSSEAMPARKGALFVAWYPGRNCWITRAPTDGYAKKYFSTRAEAAFRG